MRRQIVPQRLEIEEQVPGRLVAPLAILPQCLGKNALQFHRSVRVKARERRGVAVQNTGEHVGAAGRGKGRVPSPHLIERYAQRPHVGACIYVLTARLFGGHIGDRTDDGSGVRAHHDLSRVRRCRLGTGGCELCESEIQHLHEPVRPEHHVLGLDVAVNDASGVCGGQRGGHLDSDVERLTHRQPGRAEPSSEGLALHVLHRDVVLVLVGLTERVDRADVGVIQRGRAPRFLLEPQQTGGIPGQIGGEELEGHLAAKAQLRGEPDLAHASRSDEGDDFVRAEPCARL